MKLHFGSPDALDYEDLLAMYDGKVTRFTFPLPEYWHRNVPAAPKAFRALAIELNDQYTRYYYEYYSTTLHLVKASFTDHMIIGSDFAVAIEEKWTEPRYQTLAKWKSSGNDRVFRESVAAHSFSIFRKPIVDFLFEQPDPYDDFVCRPL